MNHLLDIDQIHCGYGDSTVVDAFSLHLRPGMTACLLGPSGCGKTTVLRAVAGFEPLQAGEIRLNGRTVSTAQLCLPPERRGVGMVFQDYALFPHLNLADNVSFGLHRRTRRERRQAAAQWLDTVGLAGYERRYPHELSGGEQQRVALARAMAPQPSLLLLDEPFSNLDVDLRERLALDVRDILRDQHTAALFVTHDQHEAFLLGERVGVMHEGRILQWDTPFDLYHKPASRFVADFIGQGRFLDGTLVQPDAVATEIGRLHGNLGYTWPIGQHVDVLLRPDDVAIDPAAEVTAQVTDRAFKGAETLYTMRLDSGAELLALVPSHQDHAVGGRLRIRFKGEHLILFPRD